MGNQDHTLLDLFAGCGGMTRGFVDAGFDLVGAIEYDHAAASTYAANFGEDHVHCGDIAEFTNVPTARVVIGGPPCQGFSNLGKRDPADARNKLWRDFVRVVLSADCDVFVMENVDRFAKSFEFVMLKLETGDAGRLADYEVQTFTLNAADFGVAQRRIRTFVVGSRIGRVEAPDHTNFREPKKDQKRWRSLRQALKGFPEIANPTPDLPDSFTEYFGGEVPGEFKLRDINVGRTYQDKSIQRYDLIPPGGNRTALPEDLLYECWKGHRGSHDVLGRLEWSKPALTIRTEFFKPEKGRYLHPQWDKGGRRRFNRALTHAEAALIQGFDDRHLWCGTKVQIARQIGNAVPPPLAHAVAKKIAQQLDDSPTSTP